MVLTHKTSHTYSHPFPTVTLAFFLRYSLPQLNPFATHVLSTDTISAYVDPATGRLHTTRIHLKKSRLPKAVIKLLPVSVTGGTADKASYILETNVVDMRERWMRTESRNLNFVGVLSVIEQQLYTPSKSIAAPPPSRSPASSLAQTTQEEAATTDVATTMVFRSRLGDKIRGKFGQHAEQEHSGWLARIGARGVQRSIETIASTKSEVQLGKSREGMGFVLERLRQSGVRGVLELRRRAQEMAAPA